MRPFYDYYSRRYFPQIARGHRSVGFLEVEKPCCTGKALPNDSNVAKYSKDGSYVDGHFQTQAVAEKAHFEGLR